MPYFVGSM